MKNWSKIIISTLLVLAMAMSLTACGTPNEEEPKLDTETPMNIMVLNGTTGFGMAKLISDTAAGNAALNYQFSVEADPSNVTAAVVNGTADIAALPTNAASVLYNKTNGGVQLLALNTRGVMYLLTSDTVSVSSFADLKGKTVYVPAQNPTFIFSYLCEKNGLKVGEDIIIDNTYAQPADLRTALASGKVDIAVLPEPMVTIAMSANDKLVNALNLTAEWDKVSEEGSLVQGCLVVRKEFAEAHPAELAAFLSDYQKSIEFVQSGDDSIATVIEESGVFAKGPVAVKALPNCNLCYIVGQDMVKPMNTYLEIMAESQPTSIGGKVPADDFYYVGK